MSKPLILETTSFSASVINNWIETIVAIVGGSMAIAEQFAPWEQIAQIV